MKLYIATRRQWYGRSIRDAVIAAGHACTASWLDEVGYGAPIIDERKALIAEKDLSEIRASDGLVALSEPDGAMVPGGKHIETGYALALGLPVFLLGTPENIFHWHVAVQRCATLPELLEALCPRR